MMTQSGLTGNNAHAAGRNRWGPGAVCCSCKRGHVSRSAGARQPDGDLDRSRITQDGRRECRVEGAKQGGSPFVLHQNTCGIYKPSVHVFSVCKAFV